MNDKIRYLSALAIAVVSLMGCGGEADSNESMLSPVPTASNTSTPAATCVPNMQKDCQCEDGTSGKQTCAKDGKSYGDCVCAAKPDAGCMPIVVLTENAVDGHTVQAGTQDHIFLDFNARVEGQGPSCTPDVVLNELALNIKSLDGNFDLPNDIFSDAKVIAEDLSVAAGPDTALETVTLDTEEVRFSNPIVVPGYAKARSLRFMMDVAATEALPGIMFGHRYQVSIASADSFGQKIQVKIEHFTGDNSVTILSPATDAGTDAQPDAEIDADAAKPQIVTPTLAADTPAGMTVVKNATSVPMVKVNLTATYDAKINRLRFHRVGTGAATDIAKACLFDQNGNGVGACHPVDASTNMVEFESLNLTIPAGNTLSYTVRADFAGDAIGITGGQHAFELQDASSVWLSDAGQVQGSFPVRGNTFVVSSASAATLDINLAANPVSGTVVKKSQSVDVLGIQITAGTNDVQLKQLPLQCQVAIHGAAYAASDCWKRVTSLALYDGNAQVGLAKAPDTVSGLAQITYLNLVIPNGMTKTLTVKASFASTASVDEPFDKVSVGVPNGMVEAIDMVYNQNASVQVTKPLWISQLSADPAVNFMILNSGTLSITANGHPASDIVMAGKDSWVPFARYRATGQYETMNIDRISVSSLPGGDNADFVQVAIASQGTIRGIAFLPAGETGTTDIYLSGNVIQVPQDGTVDFEVWAKISPTMPSATVNGAWQGVCRSGHAPALGLSSDKQDGEWTAEYAGKLNVRTTGDKSGERIYAAKGAVAGNLMVIRKTKPIVTKQNMANNVLFHGEVELYRAQIGADSSGSVALKQMGFHMDASNGLSLANFRLYRGGYQVPLSEYAVTDMAHATDLKIGTTQTGETNLFVIVSFAGEDIISGSGNVYSLRATANFTGNGHHVIAKPLTGGVYPFTGMPVGNTVLGPPEVGSPNIFHVSVNNTFGLGTFIWSDQSEVPHSDASLDWTDDYLVQDLTQSATLSN